jgi:hypothetical protein
VPLIKDIPEDSKNADATRSKLTTSIAALASGWCSADISTEFLPSPIREWCDAVVSAWGVPAIMPVSAALCALSTATAGRVSVRINARWTEPVSLYWFLFLPSGGGKSAVLRPAYRVLERWQDQQLSDYHASARERKEAVDDLTKAVADVRRQLTKSGWNPKTSPINWTTKQHELAEELKVLIERRKEADAPPPPLYLVDNINPAMLPKLLAENVGSSLGKAALTVVDTEGRVIDLILGQQTGDLDLATLLKAYTGERVAHVRASRNSDATVRSVLPDPSLTLCVWAQNSYLPKLLSNPDLNDRGFLGRCLLTNLVQVPDRQWNAKAIPEGVQAAYDACLMSLAQCPELPDEIDLTNAADWASYDQALPKGTGPEGWQERILGRVGRIAALCALAKHAWANAASNPGRQQAKEPTAQTAQTAQGGASPGGSLREGLNINLIYLSLLQTDSAYLATFGQRDRPTDPLTSTPARRVLQLVQSVQSAQGTVKAATIRRALHWSNAQSAAVIRELLESGHLLEMTPTKWYPDRTIGEYKVMSTDPDARPVGEAEDTSAAPAPQEELPEWAR